MVYWKSIFKYFDNPVDKSAGDNLLDDNLLSDNLLGDDSPTHINSNIDIYTKTKSTPNKDITGNNLLKKNLESILKTYFNRSKTKVYIKD